MLASELHKATVNTKPPYTVTGIIIHKLAASLFKPRGSTRGKKVAAYSPEITVRVCGGERESKCVCVRLHVCVPVSGLLWWWLWRGLWVSAVSLCASDTQGREAARDAHH